MAACLGIQNGCGGGESSSSRASMLKKRYAVTIFKAKTQLQQQKSESNMAAKKTMIMPQEKQQRMDDILAKKRCREREVNIMAQQEKQQRTMDMVAKRRCREREALRKMEKSVHIYDDHVDLFKGLQEITTSSSTVDALFYGTDYFRHGKRAPNLERLGLFLKDDPIDLDDDSEELNDRELKRRRESERAALQRMEKSVVIYDGFDLLKDLETLCGSQMAYDLFYGQRG